MPKERTTRTRRAKAASATGETAAATGDDERRRHVEAVLAANRANYEACVQLATAAADGRRWWRFANGSKLDLRRWPAARAWAERATQCYAGASIIVGSGGAAADALAELRRFEVQLANLQRIHGIADGNRARGRRRPTHAEARAAFAAECEARGIAERGELPHGKLNELHQWTAERLARLGLADAARAMPKPRTLSRWPRRAERARV